MLNRSDLLYGCDGEIQNSIPKTEAMVNAIVLIIMIILALFGNLLVCVAIYKYPKLRTLTNALLFSLAITDLLTPIIRLLSMCIAFLQEKWILGCQWCQLSSVFAVFLCSASILHLCVISLERYITIKHPLKRERYITRNVFFVVVFLIWLLSLAMSLFPYFGIVKMAFYPELLDCSFYVEENPKLSVILAICYFGLPFFIMVFVYKEIYRVVKQQTQQMSLYSVGSKEEKAKLRVRKEWKAVKTVIVVIGLFFILWLPYFCINAIISYYPSLLPHWLKRLVFTLAYLNSCCNWIVYSVMNKQLRFAFLRLLGVDRGDVHNRGRGLSVADINEDFFTIQRFVGLKRCFTLEKIWNFILCRKNKSDKNKNRGSESWKSANGELPNGTTPETMETQDHETFKTTYNNGGNEQNTNISQHKETTNADEVPQRRRVVFLEPQSESERNSVEEQQN